MPVHDWTKVPPYVFRSFFLDWICRTSGRLNNGHLPPNYYSLIRVNQPPIDPQPNEPIVDDCELVRFEETDPPQVASTVTTDGYGDAFRQQSVVVHHTEEDKVVGRIDLVLPGQKSCRVAQRRFLDRVVGGLSKGVHHLLVDLLPPGRLDPQGVHGAVWDEIGDEPYLAPPGLPLTVASYHAWGDVEAFVQPLRAGDRLPDMPLFLTPGLYVTLPLEECYEEALKGLPDHLFRALH